MVGRTVYSSDQEVRAALEVLLAHENAAVLAVHEDQICQDVVVRTAVDPNFPSLEVADLAIRTVDLEDDAAHHLDQELVDVVRVVVEGLCLEENRLEVHQ